MSSQRPGTDFLHLTDGFVQRNPTIRSAVLFGSSARTLDAGKNLSEGQDLDLHLVATDARALNRIDWNRDMATEKYLFRAIRPASGGVEKISVFFERGSIDFIVVPVFKMRLARIGFRLGLHNKISVLRIALNEMSTCLRGGYRFLKGEKNWGHFYSRVNSEMIGVRLSNAEVGALADRFFCDFVWTAKKIREGELCAAQYCLHRNLAETNLRLMRERLIRLQRLPDSFGLGRKLERALSAEEFASITIDSRMEREQLNQALIGSLAGFETLMAELIEGWKLPDNIRDFFGAELSR